MGFHYRAACETFEPTPMNWERWKQKMNEDVNRETTEQMVSQATEEDLRALVTLQAGEIEKLRKELELAHWQAQLNAETIKGRTR